MNTIRESEHAAELRRLGFYELGSAPKTRQRETFEEFESAYVESIYNFERPDHKPFFICLSGRFDTTYAMDEVGTFWKCDDKLIDLSVAPFHFERQAASEPAEKSPVLN